MTTTTTVSQEAREAEVTQADIDAAQAILDTWFNRSVIETILARHRQQAERAFEERERKLREALKPFARVADHEERTPSGSSILVNVDRCRDARQALKETPDAQ